MRILKLPDLKFHCRHAELRSDEESAGFYVELNQVDDDSISENADELAAVLHEIIEDRAREMVEADADEVHERRHRHD